MKKSDNHDGANKDEQIGFHKGSLNTLVKEREELLKMVNIVEQLIKMHVNSLKEMGIDLTKAQQEKKKPLEDMAN